MYKAFKHSLSCSAGLPELSSGVTFSNPAALQSLTNLQALSIQQVPLPCLSALSGLAKLKQLKLQQVQPLTKQQCKVLSCCTQLTSLAVQPVPWDSLGSLSALTRLQQLSVQLWQPIRGMVPTEASQQLPALKQLTALTSFKLNGQLELSSDVVQGLAASWQHLDNLDLCCALSDGTRGFQLFTCLRSLRLQPYRWDIWSSEQPIILWPQELPPHLTSFEGVDVWCLADKVPPQQSVLQTTALQRLVLRCVSPFDKQLLMPDMSQLSQLESLELIHSQLNRSHLEHITAACGSSLRSLRLVATNDTARIRSSGLALLTRLTALNNLQLHVHERALNRKVRQAVATMTNLRQLTILTSPDYPCSFGQGLHCLTQLSNLAVLRVGLGFGALNALKKLGVRVNKALPHCQYEMVTDV